ncbi:3-alpha,7-alpha,12-alpha-trihydroxy-5-beta-cholest-24-enoyl-CoA hydratase [Streptacidiphilus sp. PB12-B1b]|uniref:MaoC/PaaZ C-terminal domain-containing protein n=1 Tax=Streptacidiphilus sp. PB12-B1b TaxID=2705012 RepID=UPI0015F793F7|nr:MaoC/PaaZ C-terminal domain-containing protein [Streptacidiphilus sp. PB12-B1b]QMU75689.1 3-alpha,7-alpha,12-alpha-trihydroxy-5-beta-cholest-24-enoyl-CoA hydratase [Streptacidiphilus sp. PB12-B1b]
MPIDPAAALAAPPRSTDIAWEQKDVLLYHLGVGAGAHRPATDPDELRYTYEKDLQVLPSFVTVAGGGLAKAGAFTLPGLDIDLARVLHGGQRIDLHRPVPASGRATLTSRLAGLYDKGKAAVLIMRSEAADADGPLWTCDTEIYARGEGGFGGERGASTRTAPPERAPDWQREIPVRHDQALLYRLSGDWNPLHADPDFAKLAGFDTPILHGLCTYGITLKTVVDTVLGGDADRVLSCAARFAGVFFPGETLRVRIWDEGARLLVSATSADRADAPVLADTVVTHRQQ